MSKEGLEALKRIICNKVVIRTALKPQMVVDLPELYKEQIEIIEKELKRLEEYDNGAYVSVHINRYNELCDKEKALEIIKENLKYGYVFIGFDRDNKPLFQFADTKLYEEIKKNMTY